MNSSEREWREARFEATGWLFDVGWSGPANEDGVVTPTAVLKDQAHGPMRDAGALHCHRSAPRLAFRAPATYRQPAT